LKGNETHTTHNNRSRGFGGVSIDSVDGTIDFINDVKTHGCGIFSGFGTGERRKLRITKGKVK
jgi:hypothetical protein